MWSPCDTTATASCKPSFAIAFLSVRIPAASSHMSALVKSPRPSVDLCSNNGSDDDLDQIDDRDGAFLESRSACEDDSEDDGDLSESDADLWGATNALRVSEYDDYSSEYDGDLSESDSDLSATPPTPLFPHTEFSLPDDSVDHPKPQWMVPPGPAHSPRLCRRRAGLVLFLSIF